jgi:hypothetical protein
MPTCATPPSRPAPGTCRPGCRGCHRKPALGAARRIAHERTLGRTYRTLRQIEPFSDFLFCRHDAQGRPVWLMESGIPVFDSAGSLPAIAARRVTSRQRSQSRHQLARDEALFRQIFDLRASWHRKNLRRRTPRAGQSGTGRNAGSARGRPDPAARRSRAGGGRHAAGQALRTRCLTGKPPSSPAK